MMKIQFLLRSILSGCVLLGSALFASAQSPDCGEGWRTAFGGDDAIHGSITATALFDDGSGNGEQLYVAGNFSAVDGRAIKGIAKRTGSEWTSVGQGLVLSSHFGRPSALAVYDDGSGPALYLGGWYFNLPNGQSGSMAKWDGSDWQILTPMIQGQVNALQVFHDGTEEVLVAAGLFTEAGPISVNNIAKWNGTTWSRLGGGTNQRILALAVHDSGNGPELYAAGGFTIAAPSSAYGVARWDGVDWNPVGLGLNVLFPWGGATLDLVSFDDGTGSKLIACGTIANAGTYSVNGAAAWNGSQWTPLDTGLDGVPFDLEVVTGTGGSELYVAGRFDFQGGSPRAGVMQWTGAGWVNRGIDTCSAAYALRAFDNGNGVELHGLVVDPNPETTGARLATWNGADWISGATSSPDGPVDELFATTVFGAEQLFASGEFFRVGSLDARRISFWDGSSWSPMGAGLDLPAEAFEVFDDGSGPALYVGGAFTSAGVANSSGIARWDGTAWSSVGGGIAGAVKSLKVYDDGAGPQLYAGGDFPGSLLVWDGVSWSQVLMGADSLLPGANIMALEVYDDGGGLSLFASGLFAPIASAYISSIGRWDGSSWNLLPAGGPYFGYRIDSLAVNDDGGGAALFVASTQGGQECLFKWTAAGWSNISGLLSVFPTHDLQVFDDGDGEALYLCGQYGRVNGLYFDRGVRWDGTQWSPLGLVGPNQGLATSMAVFGQGDDRALYFATPRVSTTEGDSYLTKWKGCTPGDEFCHGDLEVSGACTPCPCGNDSAVETRGGCLNSNSTSARLRASGSPEMATPTLRFTIQATLPSTVALLISGNAALPVAGSCPVGSGIATPAFDGLRCVGQGIERHGVRAADSQGDIGITTPGWGPPDDPSVGIAVGYGFAAGQTRFFQAIYRDNPAAACLTGLNTTNGVSVTFR